MTSAELQSSVKKLLLNTYVDPNDRERLLPKLATLSEGDLLELNKTLEKYVYAQQDVEGLLMQVAEAQHANGGQNYAQILHPLYGLTLENIADVLSKKTITYLKQNISIRDEYELYLATLREIIENDPEHDTGTTIQDVRLAFLSGITNCKETLPSSGSRRTAAAVIETYDNEYKIDKSHRAAFEEKAFAKKQNLSEEGTRILQALLETYDYILYTDAAAEDPDILKDLNSGVSAAAALKERISLPSPLTAAKPSSLPQSNITTAKPTTKATLNDEVQKLIQQDIKPSTPVAQVSVPQAASTSPKPTRSLEAEISALAGERLVASASRAPRAAPPPAVSPKPSVAPLPRTGAQPATPAAPANQSPQFVQAASVLFANDVEGQVPLMNKNMVGDAALIALFFQSIIGKQATNLYVSLRLLAERGLLSTMLKQDTRLETMLKDFYQRQNRSSDIESLRLAPTNPLHLKNFIRFALQDQLRLSESDAAHAAVDLVNIANRQSAVKLAPWAYYDMQTASYHWI